MAVEPEQFPTEILVIPVAVVLLIVWLIVFLKEFYGVVLQ